jgi:hypothetical protein
MRTSYQIGEVYIDVEDDKSHTVSAGTVDCICKVFGLNAEQAVAVKTICERMLRLGKLKAAEEVKKFAEEMKDRK